MKTFFTALLATFAIFLFSHGAGAQNSVLVNFGANNCGNSPPVFSLIKNPLGANPTLLANCGLGDQLPDFYNVFIAYNPKDGKIYVADVRTGVTKIWRLDMGLPASIACPPNIPVEPDYTYDYVSNNFEFDNNGDLWSFSMYDPVTGRCNMDKFDVNTGTVINTRQLQFPEGHFPTTISSGDLCILPNGRMFATLGDGPSQLYEILDYNSTSGNATAVYLQTLPLNCFGIAYLNGQLEITGFIPNPAVCYYLDYDISADTLGQPKLFQNGQLPVDNTSLTPALGTTKQLVSATIVNANTADLVYEIYLQNMGNVILDNVNVTDDLAIPYGTANVSNVSASFVEGANSAGLAINPLFNGTTETNLLAPGQKLPNQTFGSTDYFLKIQVACRVTNLSQNATYLNSAIGVATINNDVDMIQIADSSNNGPSTVVDPDNDGNASGLGENVPTPFSMAMLPVKFVRLDAFLNSNGTASTIAWEVATPTKNAATFEVQYSVDGTHWIDIALLHIANPWQAKYEYLHQNIPSGKLYYRIRQTDIDGVSIYSKVVVLNNTPGDKSFTVYPNPATAYIQVSAPYRFSGKAVVELYNVVGKKLLSSTMSSRTLEINTSSLPSGTYLLKFVQDGQVQTKKLVIGAK